MSKIVQATLNKLFGKNQTNLFLHNFYHYSQKVISGGETSH